MDDQLIIRKLTNIEKMLIDKDKINKDILSLTEACEYLDLSASFIYKLTSNNAIPFYKPNGKRIYFKRAELDEWLLKTRVSPRKKTKTNNNEKTNT